MTSPATFQLLAAQALGGPLLRPALRVAQQRLTRTPLGKPPAPMPLLDDLAQWRQRYHLSQDQVAELLEVSLATYRKWEAGRHCPQRHRLTRLRRLVSQPPPRLIPATLRQHILMTLRQMPGRHAHYTVLAQRMGKRPTSVRVACYLMTLDGRLTWVKPGIYAIAGRS